MLDVGQKEADVVRNPFDVLIRHMQRRFHRGVNALTAAHAEHFGEKLREEQALAAREGHAASGLRVVVPVLHDFPEQPLGRVLLSAQGERFIGAGIYAPAAENAVLAQKDMPAVPDDMALRAERNAPAAADAFALVKYHFGREGLAFRIVAPAADKVAALEIYHCAHARAVVHGAPRNIDQPRGHIV